MVPVSIEDIDGTGLVQLSDDVAEETDFAVEEPDEPSTARPVVGGENPRVAFRRRRTEPQLIRAGVEVKLARTV
jgi:hypothetical protein